MSRKIRNIVVAVALLAAAGTAAPTPGGHGTGIADDIVAITLAPEIADLMEQRFPRGCSQECTDCRFTSSRLAKLGSSDESSGAHTPRLNECDDVAGHAYCGDGTHQPCFAQQEDGDAQARQAVFAVLSEGEPGPGALVELLATYPNVVWLNRERSAIQVLSCTGGIFAHLPVQVVYRAAQ